MNDYLKYYWLETDYLEKEVWSAFDKNHSLTAEQFFAIIIWKRNASKTLIKKKLLSGKPVAFLNEIIENITREIHKAPTKKEKLRILLEKKIGIDLSIASAILTILYPTDFTVYDYRVQGILGYPDITPLSIEKKIERYFSEYIPAVRLTDSSLSLRNCDRVLWAKSWYEGLRVFVTSGENSGRSKSEKDLKQEHGT